MNLELRETYRSGTGTSATVSFNIYFDGKKCCGNLEILEDAWVTIDKENAILHIPEDTDLDLHKMELLVIQMRSEKEKIQYAF